MLSTIAITILDTLIKHHRVSDSIFYTTYLTVRSGGLTAVVVWYQIAGN